MRILIGRSRLALPTLVACLFLFRGRCDAAPPEPASAVATATAWEFTDLGGTRHAVDWRARDFGGVLLFHFDLQSQESLLGLTYFDALFTRARDFGLTVVGVEATGRPAAEVRSLLQGFAAVYRTPSFPVIADPEHAVAATLGRHLAPTALLIGAHGEIVARRPAFDLATAVELTRAVERLLRRSEGFFSPALRDIGVTEAREGQLSALAMASEADDLAGAKALAWGDPLPAFEFTDTAGRAGQWAWPGGAVIRVAFFWSGASPKAAEDLAFIQGLRTRAGGEYLEILAIESTGLGADVLDEILKDFTRGRAALSFPVIPDPQRRLVGIFGAGDPLPQTFLVGAPGEVLYRADGFGPRARRLLEEKIVRAVRLADLGLPQMVAEVSRDAVPGEVGAEAPSVSRRLERDEALRFNLAQGDYFFINGQHERALLFYRRYLDLEPESLHALVRLAQIHDLTGEPAEARAWWERVVSLRSDHAEARARLRQLQRSGVR